MNIRRVPRPPTGRLTAVLFHSLLWAVLLVIGVAAIDSVIATDTMTYSERLLRATHAFAGAASTPAAPPEGLLFGLTRLAGRVYLVAITFVIASMRFQRRDSERSTG